MLRELLDLWMQLCQLAGWMAYDAQRHGLAQRYWYTALHAARSPDNRPYGAHIVRLLALQAAHRNRRDEASRLVTAAATIAKDAPLAQRAFIEGIRAHSEALSGNHYGVESAASVAQELMEDPAVQRSSLPWLYWFSAATSRVKYGQALLTLSQITSQTSKYRMEYVARLFAPNAVLEDTAYPREAAYNRVWLAQTQVRRNEIGMALHTADAVLADGVVRTPRCVGQLKKLGTELRRHAKTDQAARVRDFHHQLYHLVGKQRLA